MKALKTITQLMFTEKKDLLLSILFGVLAGLGAVALFANSGYLISTAAIMPPFYVLTISIAMLQLFSVTRAVTRYIERLYSHRGTFTILSKLRMYFYWRLEPLAPRIFERYRSGELLARIVGDVESLQNYFLRVIYPPVVAIIVFLATIAFASVFSWEIALLLLIGLTVTSVLVPVWFSYRQKMTANKLRQRRGELSTETTEFLYGFRDLKINQKLKHQQDKMENASNQLIEGQSEEAKQTLFNQTVNQAFAFIISVAVLALGAYLTAAGDMQGVYLAMLVMVSLTVFENTTPIASVPVYFEDSRKASDRLLHDVAATDQEKQNARETENEWTPQNPVSITAEGVSLPGDRPGKPILKDLSLHVEKGEHVAVVGPSGAGKSALLHTLLGIFTPAEGTVKWEDQDISVCAQESLWQGANIIAQTSHFFYGTVRDNLQLAGDHLHDDQLRSVLDKVQLYDIALDDEMKEKAANLSGGEKQRLTLARVLLKAKPNWFFDEPLSSVDPVTEQRLLQDWLAAAEGETVVYISHRLVGLEQMDRIIVMEDGAIIEEGTFSELIARKGVFYELKAIEDEVIPAFN
ncbi:thiol reductant ABC exporter subunit CydC [Salisediminibacterium halotolerans]|uniref:ATP-binding cassette, subfamily C, CydC n=1 Tax=Salisediminibacterium halotolerans TaxID=517425 RepID=A0A1H9V3D0_9BACI|nr:thiol reductant ABC exporter subunit CydC [Salisediminibacterium haloalkalitolerans]SES15803.1 ATP-binding cassette, subfamily C, CydC [Salisediminibacterium haloalkalitolerans]